MDESDDSMISMEKEPLMIPDTWTESSEREYRKEDKKSNGFLKQLFKKILKETHPLYFVFSIILVMLALLFHNKELKLNVKDYDDTIIMNTYSWNKIIFTILVCMIFQYSLDKLFSSLTLSILHSCDIYRPFFSTVHSLSYYITLIPFELFFLFLVHSSPKDNPIINIGEFKEINVSQIIDAIFIGTFLFGLIHLFIEKIKNSLRDLNHLNRMLRCLYSEFLLFLVQIPPSEYNHMKEYIRLKLKKIIPHVPKGTNPTSLTITDQNVSRGIKKLIEIEFEKNEYFKVYFNKADFNNSFLLRRTVTRMVEKRKSESIYWKVEKLEDLKMYFDQPEILHLILKHLRLEPFPALDSKEFIDLNYATLKERFFLIENLQQKYSALNTFQRSLKFIVTFFCAISPLLGYKIENNDTIAFISTMIGLAYIFQHAITDFVNGLLFIFFVHAYDIGDRIAVKIDGEIVDMVVVQINILYTVFKKWDNTIFYVHNSIIAKEMIYNYRRSKFHMDTHDIHVNHDMDEQLLDDLRVSIKNFLKERPGDFYESFMVNYVLIENTNKLNVRIVCTYKEGGQNMVRIRKLKTTFLSFLCEELNRLNISYKIPKVGVKFKGNSEIWKILDELKGI